MRMKYVIVGGDGYIGSRLKRLFDPSTVRVVDLDIYARGKRQDIADFGAADFSNTCMIWLASFHREPDNHLDREAWKEAYYQLMVRYPLWFASNCRRFVYASSMRALTDQESIYGRIKKLAEKDLTKYNATILRFGTVWGGLDRKLPNRCNTAMNYAITRGKFTGNHWTGHLTHMSKAIDALHVAAITAGDRWTGATMNVMDRGELFEAEDIRAFLRKRGPNDKMQTAFDIERLYYKANRSAIEIDEERAAAKRLWHRYGLSLSSTSPEYGPSTNRPR